MQLERLLAPRQHLPRARQITHDKSTRFNPKAKPRCRPPVGCAGPQVRGARSLVTIMMVIVMAVVIVIVRVVSVMMPVIINRGEIAGIGRNCCRKRRDGCGLRNSGNGCGNGGRDNESGSSIRHGISFLRSGLLQLEYSRGS